MAGRLPRRWTVVALLLVAVAPHLEARAAAASCQPAEPLATSLAEARVAFVGTVLRTNNRDRWAAVRVEEVWKGPAMPVHIEISGAPPSAGPGAMTSIDRTFRNGGRYLFVPLPNGGAVDRFEDNQCSATQEYQPGLDGLRPASGAPDAVQPESASAPQRTPRRALPLGLASGGVVVAGGLAVAFFVRTRRMS